MLSGAVAIGTLRVIRICRLVHPEPGGMPLAAARGCGSHRRLVEPKKLGFCIATLCRPLSSRTAALLQLDRDGLLPCAHLLTVVGLGGKTHHSGIPRPTFLVMLVEGRGRISRSREVLR
jgi:hypothetical protein